jgi:potassium/chloride transporter 9
MTVPSWKKVYTLRVAVFVEYESDVEEERGRVKALLENLRIKAEILVFWLASGDLPTYEVIVNGQSPGLDAEMEVDECLKDEDWWEELQKIRGKRGETTASEDLAEVGNTLPQGPAWPESSFQQGPRHERVERFLGLRKLLRKSKRRHTMSGLTKLGVSLGMRTHKLPEQLMKEHPSNDSASEDSGSSSSEDGESENEVFESGDEEQPSTPSAASEGDIDDFVSDSDTETRLLSPAKITRRRSHGDSMRGPPPSKKSTGEKEPKVPEPVIRKTSTAPSTEGTISIPNTPRMDPRPRSSESTASKSASISNITNALSALRDTELPESSANAASSVPAVVSPRKLEERFSALRDASPRAAPQLSSERPAISRHSSMPKFSSKPVPVTRVATEDGPGPSIMFTNTPSPPPNRRHRIPSAYHSQHGASTGDLPDHIPEEAENEHSPTRTRRGSTYSTQAIPLSFNDLPCRAQHLILNELMRQQSSDTAVMFTTLPSPVQGTSQSEKASVAYLSDLEVLCKGCPPSLMVHSNSMTVTMSL